MPSTILTKNSTTPSNEPSGLAQGELAVNVEDRKLWVGDGTSTPVKLVDPADFGGSPAADDVSFDGSGTEQLSGETDVQGAITALAATVLADYKIEVYPNGALPSTPRDPNTIYLELL